MFQIFIDSTSCERPQLPIRKQQPLARWLASVVLKVDLEVSLCQCFMAEAGMRHAIVGIFWTI